MKTYLIDGPYNMMFADTSVEEMRIVPTLKEGDESMVVAAKYMMLPTSEERDPLGGRTHGQAAHRFRGFMMTSSLLVTHTLRPTNGIEWPEEVL